VKVGKGSTLAIIPKKSMNEQLKVRLKGMQEVLMAHHRATQLLPNSAKGNEREVLVRELLEKVFPIPYRFGCGAVIDANGQVSGQLDVIVEWPFFASFPAPVGTNRLYLAESTAFVIEVKSNLSSQWGQVENTARQLRPLIRSWQTHIALNAAGTDFDFHGPSQHRIAFIAVGFTATRRWRASDRSFLAQLKRRARMRPSLSIQARTSPGAQQLREN
jgi:hypothetical protein